MHPETQARIRIVQSSANRWVKALRGAIQRPPVLFERGAPVALEGPLLLAEALQSGITPAAVFLRAGEEAAFATDLPQSSELLALPPALFASVTETESPQGVAALFFSPLPPPTKFPPNALLLVLAGIQDPGNLGTLLRSAEAFGAHGAILIQGTATPWSGKALRASAGSALRLPLHHSHSAGHASEWLGSQHVHSYAAVPSGGEPPFALPLAGSTALWIGNEGAGLSPAQLDACDARIMLPMPGPVESLNAAVAGSLLLYEAARQRAASQTR